MSKKGDSIQIARAYLDKLVLEGRLFGAIKPSSKVTVLKSVRSTACAA